MSQFIDLTGQTFGRLTVLERVVRNKHYATWLCKCSCGKNKVVRSCHLRSGAIISCGCYQKEIASKISKTHGETKTRLYNIWHGMKRRCYYKKDAFYHLYGGRGIFVCDKWKNSFESFRDWALEHGYSDKLSIDRIDVNGNYEPSNCRWVTQRVQCSNTNHNKIVEYHGLKGVFLDMCRRLNVNESTVRSRMKKGHSFEDAVDKFKKTAPFKEQSEYKKK
jgi:hypothetical protein